MTENNKKTLFIDGREVEFTDEPNLLEVSEMQDLMFLLFATP